MNVLFCWSAKQTQLSVITKTAGPQTCTLWNLQIWMWKHTGIFRPGLWLGFDYRIKGTLRSDVIIFHSIHGTHTSIFMVRKLCVYPQLLAELNLKNIYIYIYFFGTQKKPIFFSIVSGFTCFIKSIKFTWTHTLKRALLILKTDTFADDFVLVITD